MYKVKILCSLNFLASGGRTNGDTTIPRLGGISPSGLINVKVFSMKKSIYLSIYIYGVTLSVSWWISAVKAGKLRYPT